MKKILVTGGAGYIGSHTLVELINSGYVPVVVDNLVNSSQTAIDRVGKITKSNVSFFNVDLRDEINLEKIFDKHKFSSVIHFAGLKAVGESVKQPLYYYENNITGSIVLFKLMQRYKVDKLVFSSSACVYGEPEKVPIMEDSVLHPLNPYGQTKAMIEQIIKDISNAHDGFRCTILRYFNPVGAHESGLIGEDPNGIPNNLLPFISQVAVGKLSKLNVFGGDYSTHDGTAIRDYIHVTDLAKAHLKALEKIDKEKGVKVYNLGTGRGTSVLEMIEAFEKASGKKIPYDVVKRRAGDAESVYTDPGLANKELDWVAEKDIFDMCSSAWNWQIKNPNGYK